MKQHSIVFLAVLCVIVLIIASAVSISRAKHLPLQPQQSQTQEEPTTEQQTEQPELIGGLEYVAYTKEAHAGTGIAYRGSGENAKYVIVIDAGHQAHAMSETEPIGPGATETKAKVTGGTQGTLTGLAEHELNLRVSLALRDVLVEKGYTVVMVRETAEVEISNAERAQLANAVGAHVNLRIHANGDADAAAKGAMAVCQTPENPYHADVYASCRALSEAVLEAYCSSTGMDVRNVWETDTMTGTNWASVPTTILEMGFMTNAEDEALMAAEGFAQAAAEGIAQGIAAYLAKAEQTTQEEPTTEPEQTQEPQTPSYTVDLEMEASFGKTFTEVYMTMEATVNVNVRTEPSSEKGQQTVFDVLKPGERVTCVGIGGNWTRVLIDGKIYYVSAAYLKEVVE